jgi:NADPH-dependent F420 reductase
MRITLCGGTGDIGEGLALRWAHDTDHEIVIGSRDPEKADRKAAEYETELDEQGRDVTVEGHENPDAVEGADVVVLAVPAYYLVDTVESIEDRLEDDQILVSPAVGMQRDEDGLHYNRPGAGSVTRLAANAAPDSVPVVGAFHNLAAGRLATLDADLDVDTLVVGENPAKKTVVDLADEIEGLRGVEAGPIANAPEVEAVTPLLVNIAEYNEDMHDVGVTFH